jgi:hypothetical protein
MPNDISKLVGASDTLHRGQPVKGDDWMAGIPPPPEIVPEGDIWATFFFSDGSWRAAKKRSHVADACDNGVEEAFRWETQIVREVS